MMRRAVLHAPIQPGHEDALRQVLRKGPPFDLEGTAFERHQVFVAEGRIIFLFEGLHADEELRRLLSDPDVLGATGPLAEHLLEGPRLAEEAFSWERPAELDGVSFGSQPGPGDSDAGDSG